MESEGKLGQASEGRFLGWGRLLRNNLRELGGGKRQPDQ